VRSATDRVPACVGLSFPGGGRDVNWGFQRMALAVVSWSTMERSGVVGERSGWLGRLGWLGWAVLVMGERVPGN